MLTEKPRKGQRVAWRDEHGLRCHATVMSTDGNLCWVKDDKSGLTNPFIWFFPRNNEFNQMAEIIP